METRKFLVGLARAFIGALIFSLPMMLTMEMWAMGFYLDRLRLALMLLVSFPLLIGMAHYIGFEDTFDLKQDAVDVLVAFAVSMVTTFILLRLFNVITSDTPLNELVGVIALQSVPGAMGALMAQSQLGGRENRENKQGTSYAQELFLMIVGALFLAFNVAPTEEVIVTAQQMETWQTLALAVISLLLMHAIVYRVEFHGQESLPQGRSNLTVFFTYTVVGYAAVLLVNLYMMWTFNRTDHTSLNEIVKILVVLALPGAIGAAAARLII